MRKRPTTEEIEFDEEIFDKEVYEQEMRSYAEETLLVYFLGKKCPDGTGVPEADLLSEESVLTLLDTQHDDDTFLFIHNHCLAKIPPTADYKGLPADWNVTVLCELLNEMKRMCVPKDFRPGLLLLYFKFCKGVTISQPPSLC